MTADTVGGVWTYALELTRALQPYGIEVLLAVMGPRLSAAQHEDARQIPNLNLFKSDYKLEWIASGFAQVIASAPKRNTVIESTMVTRKTPRRS